MMNPLIETGLSTGTTAPAGYRTIGKMAESPPPTSPGRPNGYALAAFVLGLVSVPFYVYGIVAIVAVALGIVGLRRAPRDTRTIVFAATGIALGAISFVMGL